MPPTDCNNMDIKAVFFRKKLDRLCLQFTEMTQLPLVISNCKKEPIFASCQFQPDALNLSSEILVNGECVGFMSADGDDHQKIAFDYILAQIEDVLNNEFTTRDLVKTTANFWKELNFLYNVMYDIGSILNVQEICEIINLKIVKVVSVVNAQILLLDECGDLTPISTIGDVSTTCLDKWVFENGASLLLNDIDSIPPDVHIQNPNQLQSIEFPILAVPIKVRGDKFGVLKVSKKFRGNIFSTDDLKLMNSISYQIGLAVHNIYMINRIRVTEKIEKEMELASRIQKELLPKQVPKIPDLTIAGRCISANAVGGDYFDFFQHKHFYNFVLADVSGHGVSAALFMSTVRSSLRGLFSDDLSLEEVAARMNNFIVSDSGTSGMFVTLFYIRYYWESHKLQYINSGQTPPILYRAKNKLLLRLETGGSPAGFFENMQFEVKEETLEPGDVLVIYTDGFIEAVNKIGARYGDRRFVNMVKDNQMLEPGTLIDRIYEDVYGFSEGTAQQDDMTILAIKRTL
ncbi:SpoIIE family protein phosphatase [candidate division KSB1 bacterium]|nr:SpoIIE family protein phosphatase [candidate division KSB1 bacterium]